MLPTRRIPGKRRAGKVIGMSVWTVFQPVWCAVFGVPVVAPGKSGISLADFDSRP